MVVKQGDIFYVNFNPTYGHEQANIRPAIVLSHDLVSATSKMTIVAPISMTERNYPAYHKLRHTQFIQGKVLLDQTRAIDIYARKVKQEDIIERASKQEFLEIIHRFKLLFDLVDYYQ